MLSLYNGSRQARRQQERQQQKAIRSQEIIERQAYLNINSLIKTVLSDENLNKIAKKTGFQKRKRELTPIALVGVLLLGCSNGSTDVPVASLDTMLSYLRKWFGIYLKKQSLQSKINRKETAMFIKEIMTSVMSHEIDRVLGKLLKNRKKKAPIFLRILIQDSTVISLPETLSKIFKGCGGTASKAAVKWDYIIDQMNHMIVKMRWVAGNVPDAALSGNIIDLIQEDDLVIRDLGYFNLGNFSKIISKKAYFISRLSRIVHLYLNKDDEQPLDLMEHLEKLNARNKPVDIDVYMGKIERLPIRLIGVKVPPEVVESRRQQYRKARGKKEPSELLKEWHGYTLMITNISRERFSLRSILKLYRIRWQIELFFKNLKSILVVDKMTGENKYRILCLIFTKLAVTWIASILYAYAQAIVGEGKEVSRFKFTRWLKDMGDLKKALCLREFETLFRELDRDLDLLCMETKKEAGLRFDELDVNKKIA